MNRYRTRSTRVNLMRCSVGMCVALLIWGGYAISTYAESDDGPFGLHWAMPKEDLTNMGIRLCCRQLGKWGERYEVDHRDLRNLPKRLGDEEKVYVYFGHTNKLLRMYIATTKIGGNNRYNQIKLLIEKGYDFIEECVQKDKDSCKGYQKYATYKKDDVEVDIGFEENLTYRDKVFITLLNTRLYKQDKDTGNPF
jgi:hypothetical protein